MAALLPEAHANFKVIPGKKGELAARINDVDLPTLKERQKFLEARRPEMKDVTLDKVLGRARTRSHPFATVPSALAVLILTIYGSRPNSQPMPLTIST